MGMRREQKPCAQSSSFFFILPAFSRAGLEIVVNKEIIQTKTVAKETLVFLSKLKVTKLQVNLKFVEASTAQVDG